MMPSLDKAEGAIYRRLSAPQKGHLKPSYLLPTECNKRGAFHDPQAPQQPN